MIKRMSGLKLPGVQMVERSKCGSGGCITCPFSFSPEAEQAQNWACLPSPADIIRMKEQSNHNWACHDDESKMCGGYVRFVMKNRHNLNVKEGNLISYTDWVYEGEEKALENAEERTE